MGDPRRRPLCDYCDGATAMVYCRADSAKLCFACDREVHATNQLFAKHARAQLCDVCGGSPASIFCAAESAVLCHDCDWERHSSSHGHGQGHHDRRPLEGFSGRPSVSELLAILGFEGLDKKALLFGGDEESGGGFCGPEIDAVDDFLVWDVPCAVGLDDLIVSDSSRTFHAMGVPPLPKNRNAVCGQHKDEVLGQLRELAKTEPDSNYENAVVNPLVPEQIMQPRRIGTGSKGEADEANTLPIYEARSYQWFIDKGDTVHQDLLPEASLRSHLRERYRDSEKHSDAGDSMSNDHNEQSQHPIDSKALPDLHKVAPYELTSQERETAISRYKEKRKTRRFDKRIRYESRKVRAESRTRIRGRFAKIEN